MEYILPHGLQKDQCHRHFSLRCLALRSMIQHISLVQAIQFVLLCYGTFRKLIYRWCFRYPGCQNSLPKWDQPWLLGIWLWENGQCLHCMHRVQQCSYGDYPGCESYCGHAVWDAICTYLVAKTRSWERRVVDKKWALLSMC